MLRDLMYGRRYVDLVVRQANVGGLRRIVPTRSDAAKIHVTAHFTPTRSSVKFICKATLGDASKLNLSARER